MMNNIPYPMDNYVWVNGKYVAKYNPSWAVGPGTETLASLMVEYDILK